MDRPIYARAIFFDAVGTLFRVRGSVGQIYWELARSHGVSSTPEEIEDAFQEVFLKAPPLTFSRLQSGRLRQSEKEWWKEVVKKVFTRVGMIRNFDEYFNEVFRVFSGIRGWVLYPETMEVLEKLKALGFTTGVISNFDSRLLTVCSDLQIFQYLDSIHVSSRSGSAKPDPSIFEKALAHHGLRPGEAVHVGDSLKEDVEGAKAAGLTPVLIDRNPGRGQSPETKTEASGKSCLAIKTLREILPAIQPL